MGAPFSDSLFSPSPVSSAPVTPATSAPVTVVTSDPTPAPVVPATPAPVVPATSPPTLAAIVPTNNGGCSVCGDGKKVGNADAIFEFPGQPAVQCSILEMAGMAGAIP